MRPRTAAQVRVRGQRVEAGGPRQRIGGGLRDPRTRHAQRVARLEGQRQRGAEHGDEAFAEHRARRRGGEAVGAEAVVHGVDALALARLAQHDGGAGGAGTFGLRGVGGQQDGGGRGVIGAVGHAPGVRRAAEGIGVAIDEAVGQRGGIRPGAGKAQGGCAHALFLSACQNGRPTTGVLACATSRSGIGPDSRARRPACVAIANARAIATGSPACATAVLSSTPS